MDRAIDYAYETVKRFPDRRIFLTGEIIHNPSVNKRLASMGVQFLSGAQAHPEGDAAVKAKDVVILPAFGVTVAQLDRLSRAGATLVDTTCGSVLNVWKNVERYAREGFTSIVHGKHAHEETQATCSRVGIHSGHYLVVLDRAEADVVAEAIRNGCDRDAFLARFAAAVSEGFEPERELEKIGLANQTTMLSAESLEIAELLRAALEDRYGAPELENRYRAFDTICSATQDRQDAVELICDEGVDLMLVVGGYNSSNTGHLREIAAQHTRAYHIADSSNLVSAEALRHLPEMKGTEATAQGWLGAGKLKIGITSGASTPNSRVGEVIGRLLELRGEDLADLPS